MYANVFAEMFVGSQMVSFCCDYYVGFHLLLPAKPYKTDDAIHQLIEINLHEKHKKDDDSDGTTIFVCALHNLLKSNQFQLPYFLFIFTFVLRFKFMFFILLILSFVLLRNGIWSKWAISLKNKNTMKIHKIEYSSWMNRFRNEGRKSSYCY